jgi:hypothetical protein
MGRIPVRRADRAGQNRVETFLRFSSLRQAGRAGYNPDASIKLMFGCVCSTRLPRWCDPQKLGAGQRFRPCNIVRCDRVVSNNLDLADATFGVHRDLFLANDNTGVDAIKNRSPQGCRLCRSLPPGHVPSGPLPICAATGRVANSKSLPPMI